MALQSGGDIRICASCGRRIEQRKRWKNTWDAIRYCSQGCRRRRLSRSDRQLEVAIQTLLLQRRGAGATICPSEAARETAGAGDWRELMEPARRAARRLVAGGLVEILQKGKVVDPSKFRGPIRIRATAALTGASVTVPFPGPDDGRVVESVY